MTTRRTNSEQTEPEAETVSEESAEEENPNEPEEPTTFTVTVAKDGTYEAYGKTFQAGVQMAGAVLTLPIEEPK